MTNLSMLSALSIFLLATDKLKLAALQQNVTGISDGPDFTRLRPEQMQCLQTKFPAFYAAAVGYDEQYNRVREALQVADKVGFRSIEVIFDPTNKENATAQIDGIAGRLKDVCELRRFWISVRTESKRRWQNSVNANEGFIDELVAAALRHSSLWAGRGCISFEVGVRTNEIDWKKITGNSEWLQRKWTRQTGRIIELWYMVHDENSGIFEPFGGWQKRLRDIASKGRLTYSTCHVNTPGVYQATEWETNVAPPAAAEISHVADHGGLKLPAGFPKQILKDLLRSPGDFFFTEWRKIRNISRAHHKRNIPGRPAKQVQSQDAATDLQENAPGYEILYFGRMMIRGNSTKEQKMFFKKMFAVENGGVVGIQP